MIKDIVNGFVIFVTKANTETNDTANHITNFHTASILILSTHKSF